MQPAPSKRAPGESALPAPEALAAREFEGLVRRLADDLAFGAESSPYVGAGLEFAATRPYVPGDSIRSIDWRASARADDLLVKEREAHKRVATYIVVDTSASMCASSGPLSKHALAVWLAAALGLVAQRRMSPVGLVAGGDRELRSMPSLRRGDLWRALEGLRRADRREGTRLGERSAYLAASLPRASFVIAISDLHDPGALAALGLAAQRHDVLAIQLRDPAERGRLRAGFLRAAEAETDARVVAGGRARFLPEAETVTARELARAGVEHLLFDTDRPFLAVLRQRLAARAHLGRGSR